jgi:AcrR family transcriptional regulator
VPRVSESHLAARRQQISEAAERCFARNGFHATSMQDVIREAGLSAGAVYRYFPSKAALIREIATETITAVTAGIDVALQTDPLPPLDQVLDTMLMTVEPYVESRLRIAVQAWGEALRNPELAEIIDGIQSQVRERLVKIARRAREDGQLPPDSDDQAVAAALFGQLPGYILQRVVTGAPARETYIAGLRALLHATPNDR